MFDPDLERFKRKYDERFDFNRVTHELLSQTEQNEQRRSRSSNSKLGTECMYDDEVLALRRQRSKEARQANRARGLPKTGDRQEDEVADEEQAP